MGGLGEIRLASDRDSVNYRHSQPGLPSRRGPDASHGGTLREKDSESTLAV